MKHTLSFGWLMASIGALALFSVKVHAQNANQAPTAFYSIHVEDLTAHDRDALQRQIDGMSDLKLVFTCVPAGIMVFAGENDSNRTATRQRALLVLNSRWAPSRITELDHGIREAETACAQTRN